MESVLINGRIITKARIVTTDVYNYDVWEPFAGHSTVKYSDDLQFSVAGAGKYGRLGTRELPTWIALLPRGAVRLDAVRAFHGLQYEQAYALISAAFPEVNDSGVRDMGRISRSAGWDVAALEVKAFWRQRAAELGE